MDVNKTLRELYAEKRRIDAMIASLENRLAKQHGKSVGRRGRTSMTADERQMVSQRMKLYWESRRARTTPNGTASEAPVPTGDSANA